MKADPLLKELTLQGIQLAVKGDELIVQAPQGILTDKHKLNIRKNKAILMERLHRTRSRCGPLSGAQRQMLFLHRLKPDSSAYTILITAHIRPSVDNSDLPMQFCPQTLGTALTELIRRHEALRTRIEEREQNYVQVVDPPKACRLPVRKIKPDRLAEAIKEAGEIPFNLSTGPLFRTVLFDHGNFTLVVTAHHLILDGLSCNLLFAELSKIYSALQNRQSPDLPVPSGQLLDFSIEQETFSKSDAFSAQLDYWRNKLHSLTLLELPTDHPRPPDSMLKGGRIELPLPIDLVEAITMMHHQTGATPFMLLLAVFNFILHRWSGQSDIAVGTPVINRPRAYYAQSVGLFIDTVVIRSKVNEDGTFLDLLESVKNATLGAFEHSDVPLDRIVAAVCPGRGASGNPFFRVMFNMIEFGLPEIRLPDLVAEVEGRMPGSRLDLTLYAYRCDTGLTLVASYDTAIFERERIDALLLQMKTILTRIVEKIDIRLSELSLRTDGGDVRFSDSRTKPLGTPHVSLGMSIQNAMEKTDRNIAISSKDEWSYRRLQNQVDLFRDQLQRCGARRGDSITIMSGRNPMFVAALLSAIQCGMVFTVLDNRHPKEMNRRKIDFVKPRCTVNLNGSVTCHAMKNSSHIDFRHYTNDTAYIAFTSGTTGFPRGILGLGHPLTHFVEWYSSLIDVGHNDRFALLSGLSHDPTLRDILVPVLNGACLCIPDAEPAELGHKLADWINSEVVTILHITPALGRLITAGGGKVLHHVRTVTFAGDVLLPQDIQVWRRLAPQARLFNAYGATETPQIVAIYEVNTENDGAAVTVPIGKGAPGVELLVLNDADNMAGIGELGEINVQTPYLSAGYLDDEPATVKRFIAGVEGVGYRRYRTGDLGRFRPDGSVEFHGRRDRQLSIRGVRIEPAAIERTLRSHPVVNDVTVDARMTDTGESFLTAYVCACNHDPRRPLRDLLFPWLRDRLPSEAIPSSYIQVECLPLKPDGKLDRDALKLTPEVKHDTVAVGRSGLEHMIATIWSAMLGLESVNIDDDFFSLGGHSLLAVQTVLKIKQILGFELPVQAIFENPTAAGLSRTVNAHRVKNRIPHLEKMPPEIRVAASPAQRRLWLLAIMDNNGPPFQIHHTARVGKNLDKAALNSALVELETRHASLRTVFEDVDGEPYLKTLPRRDTVLERFEEEPSTALTFDISNGPLWRVCLYPDGDGNDLLEIGIHHIAADGRSVSIIMKELAQLYEAFSKHNRSPLLPLPMEYRDFSAWQNRSLKSDDFKKQADHWMRKLTGLEPIALPTRVCRPPVQSFDGGVWRQTIDANLSAALRIRARETGTTLFMLFCTAITAVLYRYTGQKSIAVGTPVGIRPCGDVANLVGLFLNPVVLRCDVVDGITLEQLLKRIRHVTLEALAHSDVPFEEIVRLINPPRDRSRTPVFQVLFNMFNGKANRIILPGIDTEPVKQTPPAARYDLTIYVLYDESELELVLVYNKDLFEEAQMALMTDHLLQVLEAVCDKRIVHVSEMPLHSPCQLKANAKGSCITVKNEFFIPWDERDLTQSIGARFEAVARIYPESIAVSCAETTITYRLLWEQSALIARELARSFKPQSVVGILCSNNAMLPACILGALRAAMVYVPLDPKWPDSRLSEIAVDSDPVAVITVRSLHQRAKALKSGVTLLIAEDFLWCNARSEIKALPYVDVAQSAYILYTSGSTGTPKGVLQSHGNVLLHIRNYTHQIAIRHNDRLSFLSTFAFDAAVMDIYGALLNGAALCPIDLAGDEVLMKLHEHLSDQAVTVYHSTPTLFRYLVGNLPDNATLHDVRCVVLGGEETLQSDRDAARRHFGDECWFVNGFGPTESTLALQNIIPPNWNDSEKSVSLGYPVPEMHVTLRNDAGEQTAPYGIGEIILRSKAIALGYWKRPEETARVFQTDPHDPRLRTYRTGDLGRWLMDGSIQFVGRSDSQVKVRGHRVELGDVRSALLKQKNIVQAIVIKEQEQDRLVAWIIPNGNKESFDVPKLRRELKRQLPDFMIPSLLIPVDGFPLTATGKVDVSALSVENKMSSDNNIPLFQNDIESVVASTFARHLGLDHVETNADFFELGGNSLSAAVLMHAVKNRFGTAPSLSQFLDDPCVYAVASFISPREVTTNSRGSARVITMGKKTTADKAAFIAVVPPGERARLCYVALADVISEHRPFYAIELAQLENPAFCSVEKWAAQCIDALVSEGMASGCFLGGFSNGGIVAFEIARQLTVAGFSIQKLILIDSYPPLHLLTADEKKRYVTFRRDVQELVRERVARLGIIRSEERTMPFESLLTELIDRARFVRTCIDAYNPKPWFGSANLFHANQNGVAGLSSAKVWRRLLPGLDGCVVDCDHWDFMSDECAVVMNRKLFETG